jgi:ABC-type Fe3+-hydroxamate transport system substrate-binding protein
MIFPRHMSRRRDVLRTFVLALVLTGVWAANGGAVTRSEVVTDAAGRSISVARPFQRVISLYGAHTENLFKMGAEDILIGVGRNDAYPPQVTSHPGFSYHDGPERFLAAAPDLVLIRPMIDRGYAPLIQRLEQSGITVVSLQPGTIEEMTAYWRILGLLSGQEARAEAMIKAFHQAVADFQALAASIPVRKRVYFEAIHKRMKTFTPGSMPIFALETAGGVNVAADADRVRTTNIAYYGKERILSRAAEIDVYLAQHGAMNQPTTAMIRDEPGFDVIKAVKENQVFIIDETIVARPTWRLLRGINTIGTMLYPDRFRDHGARILQAADAALGAVDTGAPPTRKK